MTHDDLEKVFQTARQLLNRSWSVEAEQLVRTDHVIQSLGTS